MKPYKKPPKKPLFDKKQGEIFIECIDDNTHKKIAKLIFVEGMTNLEVAEQTDYCVRQIERIKIDLMKIVLKRLIEKQIPKKPIKIEETYNVERGEWVADYECPSCGNPYADDSFCSCCGQALDWGDGE